MILVALLHLSVSYPTPAVALISLTTEVMGPSARWLFQVGRLLYCGGAWANRGMHLYHITTRINSHISASPFSPMTKLSHPKASHLVQLL
ncbi:hypothetical protein BDV10DRAFT_45302 [Aspergillus recurvatus]